MQRWREAVWHAIPQDAEPERFGVRLAFLLAHVRTGQRVLDLGCGDGRFATELAAAGAQVVGADVAAEAVRRARARGVEAVVVPEDGALPFAEDAFELVWAGEVLEHVADVVGLLAEVRRVLRWGSTLLVTTPWHGRLVVAPDAHFDPRSDHLRFFSARTLRAVLRDAGFADVEVRASGRPPRGLHAVAR
ncbi:MAG TPA: class I SAM-dependent methyltransferase [Solirubrobacteraceae bacterium]|nr:class I SAM-dependent methyltransferase [Solirubrobacteraceae bacterium]